MSAAELARIRTELESEFSRLSEQVDRGEQALTSDLNGSRGVGAGDDEADRGAHLSHRLQQTSLTDNAQQLLQQTALALARMESGSCGLCEVCGTPIPRARLLASPRATTCMMCQQHGQRR